jgi:hypothetical protein
MTSAAEPAVNIPEFTDAKGLEALLAAGGRQRQAAPSHGGASPTATPPAAVAPIPETPEPFKQMIRQLDTVGSTLATLLTGVEIDREPAEYMDQVAEGMWPIAHVYGAGAEKPSKVMLWVMFALSLGGLLVVKVARFKKAKEPKEPATPAPLTVVQ